jgi:hypothetical protein
MRQALTLLWVGLAAWWPGLASAEEAVGEGYHGITTLYYTVIWSILCYGLYDTFGGKAFYVGAPMLGLGLQHQVRMNSMCLKVRE